MTGILPGEPVRFPQGIPPAGAGRQPRVCPGPDETVFRRPGPADSCGWSQQEKSALERLWKES